MKARPAARAAWALLALAACTQLPPLPVEPPAAPGRPIAVFDVDGTLTPAVLSIHDARPGAAAVTQAFARKGYAILYLTTRMPGFQVELPKWLDDNGFAPGWLQIAQTPEERADPGGYKAAVLARYADLGWRLAYGFGDSSTDFRAYAAAGIPRGRVVALKREGKADCDAGAYHQCVTDWSAYLPYVEREVPAAK
jgi:hypothetical protein